MASNAPIFMIGLPRSGSTLWARLMYKNPAVAVFPEMHFLNPWNPDFRTLLRNIGDISDDRNVDRLISAMFSDPSPKGIRRGPYFWSHMRRLAQDGLADSLRHRLLETEQRDIGAIFKAIIEESTRCQSKDRAFVQFPVYPVYMHKLIEWWPECYLLYIARDPRSLAASKSNDPGGIGKLNSRFPRFKPIFGLAGISFATFQFILASRAHSRLIGHPNYRVFRYEQLVSKPLQTVNEACQFCDLPFDEAMLQPGPGQASSVTGARSAGFDDSRINGWRKILSPWQATLIRRLTSESMRRFGYLPE